MENEVNIACWIEMGVPWHQQKRSEQLPELMKSATWDSQLTITSNNIHEKCRRQQFGGIATILFDYIATAGNVTGYDATAWGNGLGLKYKENLELQRQKLACTVRVKEMRLVCPPFTAKNNGT